MRNPNLNLTELYRTPNNVRLPFGTLERFECLKSWYTLRRDGKAAS